MAMKKQRKRRVKPPRPVYSYDGFLGKKVRLRKPISDIVAGSRRKRR